MNNKEISTGIPKRMFNCASKGKQPYQINLKDSSSKINRAKGYFQIYSSSTNNSSISMQWMIKTLQVTVRFNEKPRWKLKKIG